MATRDDDHDRTRRRGSSRDEQAAQRAMVRGLRWGLRAASGKTKAPRSTAPAGAPGAPKGGPSGRVGKHQGKTTRTFHINVGSVKVGAGAAGSVDYLAREGHWSERDDLEVAHGDIDLMKEAIREIDRTARARRGPTAETVVKTLVFELPRDATPEQRATILREVVEREIAKGHVAVGAVHYPTEGDPQPHIHVAITARPVRRRDDGTIEVIRARRNVAYAVKAEVRKLRFDTAELINLSADPAIKFYGGRDAQMDEPGIQGRRPRHRIPHSLWHKEGWRDIPEEERKNYAEKHKLDREKNSADKIKKEADKTERREARWEKQGAVSKEKVQRPFKLANDIQQKMVYTAAAKANFTLPQGWRKFDGGDLMAVMNALNGGDIDKAREKLAEAQKRAELLESVLAPLLAELEAARAQTQRSPEPAAPAPPVQETHYERDDRGPGVDGAGRGPGRAADGERCDGRGRPAAAPVAHPGRNRRVPPPAARGRLRSLSDVDMVSGGPGTPVLLPQHVPDHLEDQPTRQHHPLRRSTRRADLADALRATLSRVTAAEVIVAGDGIAEAEKWAAGTSEAQRAVRERELWQEALDEALAAGDTADQRQQFAQVVTDAGRVLADRLAWQAGIDAAIADGATWQLSARLAQAAEVAGADIIARQAMAAGIDDLLSIDSTTVPALTASLPQEHNRRSTNVARTAHRPNRVAQSENRSGTEHPAAGGNDYGNLEEHTEAGAVGRPESGAAVTRSDGRLADPDQPRPGTTGGRPAGDKRDAIPPDFKRNEPVGRAVAFETRRDASGIHQIYAGTKHVALLDKEDDVYYLVPIYCGARGGGPLRLLEDATIDIQADITDEIYARYYHMKKKRPDARISLLETPPEKPVEATAPKVAPLPAPPPPAQEATMAKPVPKPPRQPTENELRNADIQKIITDEPNIRQAWSDIDLRLAQDIDQMKHGDLADALINGSKNRYDLAHSAGYLSKENLARINARDKERYEIDPPKSPSREVVEKQEQEKQTASDRIRAAFEKLAAIPSAKDAFESGKRLMEALKEMMAVNQPQAKQNADKRHPDQKHPDEITPEDFKQLVREERERQMKDPAVYIHRDRAEVVVARRLAEKRRALEERNSDKSQPPIIIVVQQQQGEDLDRLIGRLSDPSKLHALTTHLKTIGGDVRYPAVKPMDLIPPASMTRLAVTVEQMIAQELGRHKPAQQATSPSAPSAAKAQQSTAEGIYWPRDDFDNAVQRREAIMRRLNESSPRELEELRVASKSLSAEKRKLSADVSAQCYANGVKQVEVVMVDRGLLSVDDTAAGRLRAAQERHRQQQARGGGRVD